MTPFPLLTSRASLLALLLALASPAWAQNPPTPAAPAHAHAPASSIRLPEIITPHMVLQRDRAVPLWGWAKPAAEVTVTFSGQTKTARADEKTGKWTVTLDAMPANAQPQSIAITAKTAEGAAETTTVDDVLIGEVWLASGQSNMEWEMQMKPDSTADIPNVNNPQLRLIEIPKTTAVTPQEKVPNAAPGSIAWRVATPESGRPFSAVAYYFGQRLQEELKVPVGMIQSAWGGTRIEPWTPLHGFDDIPALAGQLASAKTRLPDQPEYRTAREKHVAAVEEWLGRAKSALEKGEPPPAMPVAPADMPAGPGGETVLYNAMIHPLVPYGIKGAIWYQGESNHAEGLLYVEKTRALLQGWRKVFQAPELPFYFVQIAPFQYGTEAPEILAQFWVAQRLCLDIPHTGMAPISDIGEIPDIHPANKKEVARRLSLWALAKTYGREGLEVCGPLFKSFKVEGHAIRLSFDHAAGLKSRDGKPLDWFEIAGEDGVFAPAEAKIDGETLLVSSAKVAEPKQARFAWSKLAIPNLANGAGLPGTAFHTHWPVDPDLGRNLAHGKPYHSSDHNNYQWHTGLTDGTWGDFSPTCFATGAAPQFPKTATIDLQAASDVRLVRFGVPPIGSTKTVAVEVSEDGRAFAEVGVHSFEIGKRQRATLTFEPRKVRFVRLVFREQHAEKAGDFDPAFAFCSEVEVYGPQ